MLYNLKTLNTKYVDIENINHIEKEIVLHLLYTYV